MSYSFIKDLDATTKNASNAFSCFSHAAEALGCQGVEEVCNDIADKTLKLGTSIFIDLGIFGSKVLENYRQETTWKAKEYKDLSGAVKSFLALVVLFIGKKNVWFPIRHAPGCISTALQVHTIYDKKGAYENFKNVAMLCLILKIYFEFNALLYIYKKSNQGLAYVNRHFNIKPLSFLPQGDIKIANKLVDVINGPFSLYDLGEKMGKLAAFIQRP